MGSSGAEVWEVQRPTMAKDREDNSPIHKKHDQRFS